MKYFPFHILSLLLILRLSSCSFLPVQSKPDVPSDHTNNRGGFLHKNNAQDVEDCADCHGSDLKGGVYFTNGRNIVTQSCYQCHGNIWEGRGNGSSNPSGRLFLKH